MSVKSKITLWFSALLIITMTVTFMVVISVSSSMMQKTLKNSLSETVEKNVGEVEYYYILTEEERDKYAQYIEYQNGVLQIDDDFLNRVNGIVTGLYEENGSLIYGENPLGTATNSVAFSDSFIQTISISGVKYYIFDRKLEGEDLSGLWLRGTVCETEGEARLSDITRISLLVLASIVFFGIIIGVFIAGKVLKPIEYITKAAEKINSGNDLKERINIGHASREIKDLSDQFDNMVDRLDKAFEKEKRFTSDASHELRTPVSVISAQCEYTLESPREIEEYIDSLEVISRQTQKMSSLINDMLYISRFENKKYDYVFEKFNFSLFIKEICHDMSLIKEKNISLTYSVDEDIYINGHKELLERLTTNLINNAFKYGKQNGKIEVILFQEDNKTFLTVKDDGVGISDEEKEKIFERFYRSDKSRNSGGTGLGLSIASEIAKLHGGNITVESSIGNGSKFIFSV
jgi:signal transduction histidine kinase